MRFKDGEPVMSLTCDMAMQALEARLGKFIRSTHFYYLSETTDYYEYGKIINSKVHFYDDNTYKYDKKGKEYMRIPIEIERKIGMIKACGVRVSVIVDTNDIPYNVVIGKDIKTFDKSADFFEYIDAKLKEACGGKKL